MNKTAIKNFAVWARNKLIADITYKAGLLGVSDREIKNPLPQSTQMVQFFEIGTKEPYSITGAEIEQRKKLIDEIQGKANQSDYETAYKNVVEEVAYTWFNRLIAVRFMEVNDYLPTQIRVLSSESNSKSEPDLVTHPMDADLNYTPYEKDRIMQLKSDNKLDELFRMIFIKQCNILNEILPELFEKTNDYTELLMNVSFTDNDGVVYHLVHDISEDDFKEAVEIIGWMYQYYNDQRKNEVISINKGTVKKEDIPAATQLFTTDWVVRYMVDNSLGRYWIERNPNSQLKEKLEYFVTPKSGEIQTVNEKIEPQDVTFFDPCMGSGHILVYAFDVLMEIYRECGYSDRDAAVCILQNNLFGLDIDDRAYQLAYFAVMMKARSYNRRVLTMGISPNLCAIQESNRLKTFSCYGVTTDKKQDEVGEYLIQQYLHAKEIGSLQTIDTKDYVSFESYIQVCYEAGQLDIFSSIWFSSTAPLMQRLARQANIMSKKYAIVATNPPYMNKFDGHLKTFVTTYYKLYSGDLFSVFMYRNFDFCKTDGYSAFMSPFVWMFIKTYENLRKYIIHNKSIVSLIQMEYSAFEEATVPICTFVLKNEISNQDGYYFKLSEFKGGMNVQKNKVLEALADRNCSYLYEADANKFSKISGMPIAYWVSEKLLSIFQIAKPLKEIAEPKVGLQTANNNLFLRLWFEVNSTRIGLGIASLDEAANSEFKWFPYNKGGAFRRWYGNRDYVINWENNGRAVRNYPGAVIRNPNYYFRECITWSDITSATFSGRFSDRGSLFDVKGSSGFPSLDNIRYILGFLNSNISQKCIKILNPTISTQVGDMARIPIFFDKDNKPQIDKLVQENIDIAKTDWDSYETSMDFVCHPFISNRFNGKLSCIFENRESFCNSRYNQLKSNEEELNRIFINIYGLQNELLPEVEENEVTINKANLKRDVRSFLSYAVGCMFGRYSLDVNGLTFAGGKWDDSKYRSFIPDRDNILPITDEEYFEDDIIGMLCIFLNKTFGSNNLEENLDFVAQALRNEGNSSRDIIRNYFLNDFFNDHCKIYSITGSGRRPIYWLFDSGKDSGFKALVYMHRYDENTIGNLRIDYLHRMQRVYESEISRMQESIENSKDARVISTAAKRKEKLVKQLKETKEYDEKVAHLALARIDINLDDGVKINYEKVQTGADGKKLDVLAKIQ